MIYIKIGDKKYHTKIHTFTTQSGQDAIRIISQTAPLAREGFLIVDENNDIISDRSDYIYLYREDENCREYVANEETIIPTEDFEMGDLPESPYTILSRQISQISNQVNEITPYTETKVGYYGETEKVFYNVPSGNTSVFFDNYNGSYSINRIENRLIVSFDTLTKATNITISIQ